MDNLTHSFVGASLGFLATRSFKSDARTSSKQTQGIIAASIVANNLPDLDFLYASITPGSIGYLLHHRGYTHTFIMGILQSLLLFFIFLKGFKIKAPPLVRCLFWICLAGPLVHIFMDSWNSYGVHPFWPLYNGWLYGDSIFIVEPWLWTFLITGLIWETKSKRYQALLWICFLGSLLLCTFTSYVPWQIGLIYLLMNLWLLGLQFKLPSSYRVPFALLASMVFVAASFATSNLVKKEVTATLRDQSPQSKLLDIAITPLPANPLCWQVFTVEIQNENTYVSRKGMVAAMPHLLGAADCTELFPTGSTALKEVNAPKTPKLLWQGEFRAPVSDWKSLNKTYCGAAALSRFLRVPYWQIAATENATTVGDLRFDRAGKNSFARAKFSTENKSQGIYGTECLPAIPPWTPPRKDLSRFF